MRKLNEKDEKTIRSIYDILLENYTENDTFDANSAVSVLSFLLILLVNERGNDNWIVELSINNNKYKLNVEKV
jgi:hypothetical protein